MADIRKLGSTSNIVRFKLSKSTDGTAFTGLTNASSGLIVSTIADNEAAPTAYTVAASNVETIVTLGTWSAPTTGKCRFKEVDATNHPGLYEFHFSDSRFSVSNSKRLIITVTGVTGLFTADYEIQLTAADVYDATSLGLSRLDAAVTSRMATYTQPTGFLAASFPTDPADASNIAASFSTVNGTLATLATAANLATLSGYVDTEVAAILAIANKLDSMLELDGSVYRLTVNALEQAPSGGGGGSTDWTADQRTAIATILGIPASGTTPEVPSAGALKVIDDFLDTEIAAIKAKTDNLPSDPADASDIASAFSTVNATLATISGLIDTEIAAIKAKTDALPADTAASLTAIATYVDTLETEVAKIIKNGQQFTATDGSGSKNVTFTRV